MTPHPTFVTSDEADLDPELLQARDEMFKRLIASAVGLPRICIIAKCRRRNRCFGAGQVCLKHHKALVQKRLPSALKLLGWPNVNDDGTPLKREAKADADH